jgi:hypothetical protein
MLNCDRLANLADAGGSSGAWPEAAFRALATALRKIVKDGPILF